MKERNPKNVDSRNWISSRTLEAITVTRTFNKNIFNLNNNIKEYGKNAKYLNYSSGIILLEMEKEKSEFVHGHRG